MNPVPLMKLVEVIDGLKTTKEVHDITLGLCEQMNKYVGTSADFPGFISNRLLMPYINEAIYILMEVCKHKETRIDPITSHYIECSHKGIH